MLKGMLQEKEQAQRNAAAQARLEAIVHAMEIQSSPYAAATLSPATLGEHIKRRIEEHQRMIKTLEWFGAHIGIDDPTPENLAVGEVIMAGLETLAARNKR